MKAEELMVGDFVYFFCDIYEKVKVTKEDFSNPTFFPRTKPIPITPEILKKNGFKKKIGLWDNNFGFPYLIREDNGEYDLMVLSWDGEDTCVLSIKHIHELQHALRLCRIEKEIEL